MDASFNAENVKSGIKVIRVKGRYMTQSCGKYLRRYILHSQSTTKTLLEHSITQRLRISLGRLVVVPTDFQPILLT